LFRLPGRLLAALLLLTAVAAPALALRAEGVAVSVDDGDSFELRVAGRGRVAVRLHAIDAPERLQAYGEAARRALADAVAGRSVHIDCYKTDRRGRRVCRAWIGGDDLQLRLLEQGHAWHFTAYLDEQSEAERQSYSSAQARAREARRGLWAQAAPMPPWTCRERLRRLQPCR
jgi:endonuclease YncB( thermonuclease family)